MTALWIILAALFGAGMAWGGRSRRYHTYDPPDYIDADVEAYGDGCDDGCADDYSSSDRRDD